MVCVFFVCVVGWVGVGRVGGVVGGLGEFLALEIAATVAPLLGKK